MNNHTNIIGITGHRKLAHCYETISRVVEERLEQLNAGCLVTGMAIGYDMLVAEVCIKNNIPFVAAVPYNGQSDRWAYGEKERYKNLIKQAWKVAIVSPGGYQIWKLFERNQWIINRSKYILAYWDGKPCGGTYRALQIAKKTKIPTENLFTQCK